MELISLGDDQATGDLAALSAAFLWATATIVYGLLGQKIPPLQLNIYKGLISIILIIVTLLLSAKIAAEFDTRVTLILLVSGVIGIGIGDTAYLNALKILGARRTLLIESLAPPLAAILALVFLREQLVAIAWCGILLTVLGVAWVIAERTSNSASNASNFKMGILLALLAALCQATGAVISRFALVTSTIDPLWSALWRLIGGTLILFPLVLKPRRNSEDSISVSWSLKLVAAIIFASVSGTYLGIWLQQTAFKFSPAGVAQTLLATSPLFVLPLAMVMGEKISLRAILGALIALLGISLLFTSHVN